MVEGEGPTAPMPLPRDADHASGEMSARTHQTAPLPPSGSVHTASAQGRPKNASDLSPRECVSGPSKPPILEAHTTRHFTSYKHRTLHELATLRCLNVAKPSQDYYVTFVGPSPITERNGDPRRMQLRAPRDPRTLFELFATYSPDSGLDELLARLDVSDIGPRQVYHAVLGRRPESLSRVSCRPPTMRAIIYAAHCVPRSSSARSLDCCWTPIRRSGACCLCMYRNAPARICASCCPRAIQHWIWG